MVTKPRKFSKRKQKIAFLFATTKVSVVEFIFIDLG